MTPVGINRLRQYKLQGHSQGYISLVIISCDRQHQLSAHTVRNSAMTPTTLFLLVIPLLGTISVACSRSITLTSAQLQPQVKMQKLRDEGKMQIYAHAADDCGEAYRWCIESGHYSRRLCVRGLEECVPVSAQLQRQVKLQELYNNEKHKIQAHAAQSDCDGAFRFCMEHYDIGFCFQGLQLCPYNTNYNK